MSIGENLRTIRKNKGFSIYRLHQLTDISQNHISAIEKGERQPSIDTLERILQPMGITVSELINENKEVFYLSDTEKTLIMNFRTMSNDKSTLFLEMSKVLNK